MLLHLYYSINNLYNFNCKSNILCNNIKKNPLFNIFCRIEKPFLFCILLIGTSALSLVEKLPLFTGKRSTGPHNTMLYDMLQKVTDYIFASPYLWNVHKQFFSICVAWKRWSGVSWEIIHFHLIGIKNSLPEDVSSIFIQTGPLSG